MARASKCVKGRPGCYMHDVFLADANLLVTHYNSLSAREDRAMYVVMQTAIKDPHTETVTHYIKGTRVCRDCICKMFCISSKTLTGWCSGCIACIRQPNQNAAKKGEFINKVKMIIYRQCINVTTDPQDLRGPTTSNFALFTDGSSIYQPAYSIMDGSCKIHTTESQCHRSSEVAA